MNKLIAQLLIRSSSTQLVFEIKLNKLSLNIIFSSVISSSSAHVRNKIKWVKLEHSILSSNTALDEDQRLIYWSINFQNYHS
jgi:hypothetical protein